MSKTHPIDELFKGQLKEYEMAPPMHLWDAIDQKRRRPKAGFWWIRKNGLLLSIGLLAIFIASVILWKNLAETKVSHLDHFPIYQENKGNTAENVVDIPEESQNLAILTPAAEQSPTEAVSPSKLSQKAENEQARPNSNDFSTNVTDATPSVTSTPSPLLPSNPEAKQLPSGEVDQSSFNPVITQKQEIIAARNAFLGFSQLPATAFSLLQAPALNDELPKWPSFSSYNGNGVTYYFEAFGSPGFASRNIQPVNETFSLLTEEWESAQQRQSALQFGLRMAAVNRKGWSLRTGFHFTQIQESFEFVHHVAEVSQIYDPSGGFVREDTIFVPSGAAINSNNQYTLLDVPVILGYQKRLQRWTLSTQAGPILNLSFQPKGTLINPNRQLVPAGSAEGQSAYRSSLGINWYAGLGLQYELQPGVHLMLEPHLRVQQSSFMESGFPVQQKFLTGGVSIGVRKQIIR